MPSLTMLGLLQGAAYHDCVSRLCATTVLVPLVGKVRLDWLDCNQLHSDEKMTRHGSTRTF